LCSDFFLFPYEFVERDLRLANARRELLAREHDRRALLAHGLLHGKEQQLPVCEREDEGNVIALVLLLLNREQELTRLCASSKITMQPLKVRLVVRRNFGSTM
jgi:hypothetical protein